MMPRSHIDRVIKQLREAVTDEWQSVNSLSAKLRRADEGYIGRHLLQLAADGEIEECTMPSRHGRMAKHYRRKQP